MAEPTTGVRFGGTLRDGSGSLITSGVTANTYAVNTTTPAIGTADTSFTTGQFDIADSGFGRFDLKILNDTDQIWWSSRAEVQVTTLQARNPTTSNAALEVFSTTNEASSLVAVFGFRPSTEHGTTFVETAQEPSDNDEAYINFELSNDNGTPQQWIAGKFTWAGLDVSDDSEAGRLEWDVMTGGSLATEMTLTGALLDLQDNAITTTGLVTAGTLTVSGATVLNGAVTLGNAAADIITINGTIAGANALVFEGADSGGANAHETTLFPIDPTADATIKLPAMSAGTYFLPVLDTVSTTAISSTPEELNILDGATVVVAEVNYLDLGATAVGTAIASKAVVVDANKDYTGIRNLTVSGELDAAALDVEGDADINGTANLDNTDIDGTLVVDGTNISLDSTTTLNIDNTNTSNGVTIGTATSGVPVTIGHGTSEVTVGDNLTVTGDLTVSGTTTTVTSTTVAIADSLLLLAKDQGTSADAVDFGLYGKYGVGGTAKYAGIFRDGSVTGDPWTFFDGNQAEPGTTVNTGGTGYDLADISAGAITSADGFSGDLTGNVTGNASGTAATVTGGTQASITTVANVVEVGALDAGSITSGFGTINNAAAINGTVLTAGTNFTVGGTVITDGALADGTFTFNSDLLVAEGKGLVVGHTAGVAAGEVTSEAQILGTTETDGSLVIYLASATNALAPKLKLVKSAHATIGTESTSVVNDEILGAIEFYGSDGTDADTLSGSFHAEVDDGSPAAGDIGTAFVWRAMPAGGAAIEEHFRIAGSGHLSIPATNRFYFDGQVNTYIVEESDDDLHFVVGAATMMELDQDTSAVMFNNSNVFIGDTANGSMTQGLTINQAANDNDILSFKSSDVAHGMTGQQETDTFASFKKSTGGSGGLRIQALGDADTGGNNKVLWFNPIAGSAPTTTTATSSLGVLHIQPQLKSGSNVADLGATDNAVTMSDGTNTRWILKGSGDTWQGGGATFGDTVTVEGADVGKGVAKGWIKFVGSGTIAISASHNVTSITDDGTGTYDVTWATDFSSADYSVTLGCANSVLIYEGFSAAPTAGITEIVTKNESFSAVDGARIYCTAHGDQ